MNNPKQPRTGALVVVSNRLPYNFPKEGSDRPPKRNVGGLVNALEPVLAANHGSWIGWDGNALSSSAAVSAALRKPRTFHTDTGVDLLGVPLSELELTRYYHGLSNRTLWPLFHNLLDKSVFNAEDWAAYERVNRRFAETVMARVTDPDRLWIHDYHLMLVPKLLREMGFAGRIDFFLHIPFPPPEIFNCLPWRDALVEGMLATDAVAFHIDAYRDNFARVVRELRAASVSPARGGADLVLSHPRGLTLTGSSPIGIDVAEFERIADSKTVQEKVRNLRRAYGGRELVFGADRLDYTKGIKERLLAFERLLQTHPERAGSFSMVQVVVPSRHQVDEYRRMKLEIDQHVGRINGDYGRDGWTPVHYKYRALSREDLVAYYRAASVALVTPLRDGMNLVAPEFVASRTDNDGVLVLSEFAGVAQRLPEALRVNPYDLDACAEAIASALDMPAGERAMRMKSLRARVQENTIETWAMRCLGLGRRGPHNNPTRTAPPQHRKGTSGSDHP